MPALRKRAALDGKSPNGLYVHSNPPRVLQLSAAHIKQLIRNGDIEKLEQVVLEGQGKKLVGEYSADYKTRTFLKSVPALMSKISLLHDSVNSDRVEELKAVLDEEPEKAKKLVMAKDENGTGLLHKAVYYDLKHIYKFLIEKYPHIVSIRDADGRTAYHYSLLSKDSSAVQKMLKAAGADPSVLDYRQHSPKYYSMHIQELELPSGQLRSAENGVIKKNLANKEGLNFKKSNIRIWIHQRNLANLQQVVWEGHGSKLLVEHSNNTKIKKFLDSVPHIMGLIRDVHTDVQNDDIESLKKHVGDPVPPIVLSGKDLNGLTALHKAAGLGRQEVAEYMVGKYPQGLNVVDCEGRTPLHYAALAKDDGTMYNFLVQSGADESILDNRQKSPAYYKTRSSELDSKLLNVIPECPRSAKESFAANFDWGLLTAATPVGEILSKTLKKSDSSEHNGNSPHENEHHEEADEKDHEEPEDDAANNNNDEETGEKITAEVNGNKEENHTEKDSHAEETEKTEEKEEPKENQVDERYIEEEKVEETTNANAEEIKPNEETIEEEKKEDEPDQLEEPEEPKQETEVTEDVPKSEDENVNGNEEKMEEEPNEKGEENNNENDNETNENNEHEETPPAEETNEENTSKTRPSSKMEIVHSNDEEPKIPSKPNSAKSRPSSHLKSRTRPSSRAEAEENSKTPEIEPEGVIEGVVNGEDEVQVDDNEGQNRKPDSAEGIGNISDEEVGELVAAGNMEKLAALVLDGQGERLKGHTSDNPELQAFLDNVPVYMSKIERIHVAARRGSLRDLQAALDRRKFAVARCAASPRGATPLHVAVAFARTAVVRYLAGRFPEAAQAVDRDGRTPLHYAAVLADNGHYYGLLVHLGADARAEDKYGYTPEYYRTNQSEFSHREILANFGAEEQETEEILADKVPNDTVSARKDLDDEDMLNVLERCYNVLHGRRNSNAISATSSKTSTSVGSNSNSSLLSKHLKRFVFDSIKNRLTKLDHNLYDLIWPSVKKLPTETSFRIALEQDFPLGIIAPDFCVYKVFAEFLEPVIKDFNCVYLKELTSHPKSKFFENGEEEIDCDLDPQAKFVITDNTANENGQVDMPFFATEEGRYLASSLGDPLIKGLTEVANKRPEDPIAYLATYLYNFARAGGSKSSQEGHHQQQQQQHNAQHQQQVGDNQQRSVPATIDVVTIDPEDGAFEEDTAFSHTSRDEHGQSMLHFAAARSHGRNALFQLLQETNINVALRDELYRTARDISIQANIPENTAEIDRYVLHIATKGDTDKLVELLLDGYDHITDIVDEEGVPIIEAVSKENQPDTVSFLQSILAFEEKRERVHHAIRQSSIEDVTTLLADENNTGSGKLLAIGKNSYGRCSLHIAVLCQQEEIVDYLANSFPDTLRVGDNLERQALHYAMGVEKMELISRVLIKAGAKRVVKDLKGRQPTYYFLNKSDILRLQEEEETF